MIILWRFPLVHWCVIAATAWLIRYSTIGHVPWLQEPVWSSWFDQSKYLLSAKAFGQGSLLPADHWYPLAYPFVAAPFTLVSKSEPFFVLDLLLFLLTCKAFQRVAGRLGIAAWPATLCFLATALVDTKLAGSWVNPWTTTLSAALIWWLVERTLAILEVSGQKGAAAWPQLLLVGCLAAALPTVRPLDALIGLTCLAVVLVGLFRRRRLTSRITASAFAGAAVVIAAYGGLHLAIYGSHPTAYMLLSADFGFIWSDFWWKAYVLLVHARPWYPDTLSITERLPWIVPGLAGLIATMISKGSRERDTILLLLAVILPVSAMMVAYADLQPSGVWRFANIHYFKWTMPAFGAGVLLLWRQLSKPEYRRSALVVLVVLVLPLLIRVLPVPVRQATPARMLVFKGDTSRDWEEAYFSRATITDAGGRMRNVFDFHQMRDPVGERAIAIRRPFKGAANRNDPGDKQAVLGHVPIQRLGERLTVLGL